MIRYAKLWRGLDLIQADARSMPFGNETYRTIIYATGVVDFMSDEAAIRVILNEGRRVVDQTGNIFVAFYQLSPATEDLMIKLGLLSDSRLRFKEILEIYRLNPVQAIAWVAKRAKVSFLHGAILAVRSWAFSSWQEKRNALHMQKMFAGADRADSLIQAAPETQAYRNEAEIRNLFARLAIPIIRLDAFGNCTIVEV
jgi:hypothetical protein